jgi:hypothetical protein
MDDPNSMPVLVYSSWQPPQVTVRGQVWGGIAGVAVGGLAGLVLMFVAAAMAGAGHGTYGPAKSLFPFSMALSGFTGTLTDPLIAIAAAQYPVYGLFLGVLTARRRRRLAWKVLGVVHACAVVLAFTYAASTYSP